MADKKVNTLFNYIGGKGWMKQELRSAITAILSKKQLDTYVEPFAGGLGAFLNVYDVLAQHGIKNVILNDINEHLIGCYNIVLNNPQDLIKSYEVLETQFKATIPEAAYLLNKTKDKIAMKELLVKAEQFYKGVRDKFNEKSSLPIDTATYLLFLQNHCFNGVYRENSKGGYNTPFNWEPKIFETKKIEDKVMNIHNIFKQFNLQFTLGSFEKINFNKNTLYYLDPPYLNEAQVENKYNKDSFSLDTQKQLINAIKDTSFIYSNHYSHILIEEITKACPTSEVKSIARKNIISASIESRKTDSIEMLVSYTFDK